MGINEVALGLTLGIASWTDWRKHKIYNKLLGPAFLLALILNFVQFGYEGLKLSSLGALVGFGLLLLPYFFGGIGAGDVKFLAVIGAYGGANFVFVSFLCGAVIGGIVSVVLLVRRKALLDTIKYFILFLPFFTKTRFLTETVRGARQEKFPYGISIALGTIVAFFLALGGLNI